MKFELKTENENYVKLFTQFMGLIFIVTLTIFLFDFALKLGIISRHYEIDHNCRLLFVEKSKNRFKKLSSLSKVNNKQLIWDFCRQVVK